MTILCDGYRSTKRKGVVRRMLDLLRDLGLPAKATVLDGFTYRALRLDDGLEMGRITAPMGAIVYVSEPSGTTMHTADSWMTAFVPSGKLRHRHPTTGAEIAFKPNRQWAYGYYDKPPHPQIAPFANEFYGQALFCPDDNQPVSALYYPVKLFAHAEMPPAGTFWTSLSTVNQPNKRNFGIALQTQSGALFLSIDSGLYGYDLANPTVRVCGYLAGFRPGGYTVGMLRLVNVFKDVDAFLKTLFLNTTYNNVACVGQYAFNLSQDAHFRLLHVAQAVNSTDVVSPPPTNPERMEWYVFAVFYDNATGNTSTVKAPALLPKINDMFGTSYSGIADRYAILERLEQLLGWPGCNPLKTPPDTAMFNDENGVIYTWTRKYGSVRWDTANGFIPLKAPGGTPLAMPPAVTATVGVRPEIRPLGGGLFLCTAFKPGKVRVYGAGAAELQAKKDDWIGVRGLYLGSPFSSWTAITLPDPAKYHLLNARAIKVTATEQVFSGVVHDYTADKYYFTMRLNDTWKILSPIAHTVADVDECVWTSGVFGDDPYVKEMAQCPAAPHALPAMTALPYTEYAALQP